jgi:hypothetical protein
MVTRPAAESVRLPAVDTPELAAVKVQAVVVMEMFPVPEELFTLAMEDEPAA